MKQKFHYLLLLFSLNLAYLFTYTLIFLHFIFPKKRKKDLIIFPFAQEGSNGYSVRISCYFEQLKESNVSFHVCDLISNEKHLQMISAGTKQQYLLYRKTIWKRVFQVLKARNYKAAFVQRGLFPFYPDYKNACLEKLLRKLNPNITIDFWDAVWEFNPELINRTVKYTDKISVVNEFIADYFKKEEAKKILFPIGVDVNNYEVKTEYQIDKENIKLFYTGQPGNVKTFLSIITPIINELKPKYGFTFIIVTRARFEVDDLNIEYHSFDESTFYKLMKNSDIGLYAVENNDYSKGKMAMKSLDYMSAGLPCIATPCGLSPYAKDGQNIILANNKHEWIEKLTLLIEDIELRIRIGITGRETMEKEHGISNSFKEFRKLVFEK